MNKENIIIRNANKRDIKSIFKLVKELAIYENALDKVIVDAEYYKKEWEKNTFYAIVAEYGKKVIGTCIYYMTFSTWKGRCIYLEDFVVQEKYRKLGVGQLLYDQLLIESKAKDATMIRWQVLDWNEPAIKFYKKNDATIDKEWWNCKVYF
ncbi:MAG: GNAT family N-acetyltransferase [Saprospiraceae bacterium]